MLRVDNLVVTILRWKGGRNFDRDCKATRAVASRLSSRSPGSLQVVGRWLPAAPPRRSNLGARLAPTSRFARTSRRAGRCFRCGPRSQTQALPTHGHAATWMCTCCVATVGTSAAWSATPAPTRRPTHATTPTRCSSRTPETPGSATTATTNPVVVTPRPPIATGYGSRGR